MCVFWKVCFVSFFLLWFCFSFVLHLFFNLFCFALFFCTFSGLIYIFFVDAYFFSSFCFLLFLLLSESHRSHASEGMKREARHFLLLCLPHHVWHKLNRKRSKKKSFCAKTTFFLIPLVCQITKSIFLFMYLKTNIFISAYQLDELFSCLLILERTFYLFINYKNIFFSLLTLEKTFFISVYQFQEFFFHWSILERTCFLFLFINSNTFFFLSVFENILFLFMNFKNV